MLAVAIVILVSAPARPFAAEAPSDGIVIDVPVALASARVVFNLDHPAFEGDQPTGLDFLKVMTERFRQDGTRAEIVAIFHGAFGYVLLDDAAYDRSATGAAAIPTRTRSLR